MARLAKVKIDVQKITKEKLYKGEKGTYLTLVVSLNDDTDQYGNNVSCYEEQTQEERTAGAKKNYLGNGKVVWTNEGQSAPQHQAPAPDFNASPADDCADLPF